MGWRSAESRSRWLLLVIFTALVVAAFLAASSYSFRQMKKVENDAVSVATNAAPSLQHLATVRGSVHEIEIETGIALGDVAQGHHVDTGFFEQDDRRLRDGLKAYLSSPFYPGERVLYNQALDEVHGFEMSVDDVLDHLQRHQLQEARDATSNQLRPCARRLSQILSALIELNARQIETSASRILRLRAHIEAISNLLHGLATLLALLTFLLCWHFVRTWQRISDEQRVFAEHRADELEQFAGRVAHDLKNPLATISARLHLARLHGDDSYARLDRQVRAMSDLIEGLLEFAVAGARPGPGARYELVLLERDVLPMLREEAREADVELTVEPLPSLTLACTPGALTSIVSNLVRNAIKYMSDCSIRRVTVRALQERIDCVVIEVADTGPGILPGQEHKIFEPFVRLTANRRTSGLGLGLATVRRLAEGYGGRVGVRSVSGAGSTFWVDLPLAPNGA
jgi:signal transduction histidine kinase